MLTDIPLAAVRYAALLNTAMHQLAPESRPWVEWERHGVGIYEQRGFDDLPWLVEWPHEKDLRGLKTAEERIAELARQGYRSDFGSADNIDQVLEHHPDLVSSQRPFLVTFQTLTRESAPDWRWHKNGPYIGTREPQCEHLGEEVEIDSIITWDVWEVRPEASDLAGHWLPELADWLVARMSGRVVPRPVLGT